MRIFDVLVGGGERKEPVARTLCPDEDHAPPCPVPWRLGYAENGLVLTVCADRATAEDVARRVGGQPPVACDPGDHPGLAEQYRIEQGLRE